MRVHTSTVTAADWRIRSGVVPRGFGLLVRLALGWRGPRHAVMGMEIAGTVDAVGSGVTGFRTGDRVFALAGTRMGGHAEFVVLKADGAVAPIAPEVGDDTAAALPFGGTTALHYLRDTGAIAPGERLLVNGASGNVGVAAIQLARHFGAEVTAVTSAANRAFVLELGAHRVLDYAVTDFAAESGRYDLILDTVGNCPYQRARPALAPRGRLLAVATDLAGTLGAALRPRRADGHRVIAGVSDGSRAALDLLMALAARGVLTPPIDRRYPLARIREAHAYVETRRKRGTVIVTVP